MATDTITGPTSIPMFGATAAEKRDFADELRKKTVGCRLSLSKFGVRKALTREQLMLAAEQFDADRKALSASKRIVDTKDPAYRAVISVRSRAKAFWRSMTVPYPAPGVRLIRQSAVDSFNDQMLQYDGELATAAVNLQVKYEELRERARQQLGDLFNEADYPSRIDTEFGIEWDFPSLDPSEQLKQLHPDIYERECAIAKARIEQAVQMTEQAFVEQFQKLVSHLLDRLAGDVDGKPKVFRDSAVENLTAFFEQFRALDIGSNAQLQGLVDMAQQAVKGVTPEELRGSVDARQKVADQLGEIQKQIDTLMVARPTRAIDLGEEEL